MKRAALITALILFGFVSGAVAFSYGKKVGSSSAVQHYPNANGATINWGKSHADSAFWQCVNETSANDADFWWLKPILIDTAYPDAEGDLLNWTDGGTGTGGVCVTSVDSAHYQCVNEVSPNTANSWCVTASGSVECYADLAVDTNITGTIDSVRIRISTTHSAAGAKNIIVRWDTAGTDATIDTVASGVSGTYSVESTRPITGLTRLNLATMEIGVKQLDAPSLSVIRVNWIVLEIFYTPARCFVDLNVDTTGWHGVDSFTITARACHTGSGTKEFTVWYDSNATAATQKVWDTLTAPASRAFSTLITKAHRATGWTDAMFDKVQIGVQGLDGTNGTDSILVSWMRMTRYKRDSSWNVDIRIYHDTADFVMGQISDNEPNDDTWSPATLTPGNVASPDRKIRGLLALRNLDSLIRGFAGGWAPDSAFLFVMTNAITGGPGVITVRNIAPDPIDSASWGVYPSTGNDVAYCHSDWDTRMGSAETAAQNCGDTIQWYEGGANADSGDYFTGLNPDTIRPVVGEIKRIDILPWMRMLAGMATKAQRTPYNGLVLQMLSAEDSTTNNYAVIGNVQPFAGADSTWIIIYGQTWNQAAAGNCPPAIRCWSDTTKLILGSITPSSVSSNGWYGGTNVFSGRVSANIYRIMVQLRTQKDSTAACATCQIHLPAPADTIVDSAFLYLPQLLDNGAATDTLLGYRVSRRNNGGKAIWGLPGISQANRNAWPRSNDANRLAVGASGDSTTTTSGNRPWNTAFPGLDTVGTDDTKDYVSPPVFAKVTTTPRENDTLRVNITAWIDSLINGFGTSVQDKIVRHNGMVLYSTKEVGADNVYERYNTTKDVLSPAYIEVFGHAVAAGGQQRTRRPKLLKTYGDVDSTQAPWVWKEDDEKTER